MIGFTRIISLFLLVTFLASKSEAKLKITGLLLPVVTPCDEYGNVTFSKIPEYAKLLKKWNVTSIIVGGETSESRFLSTKVMKKLFLTWVVACKSHNIKVCTTVGYGRSYEETLELVEYCGLINVSALFIRPIQPNYNTPQTTADFVNNTVSISKAAPNLDVVAVLTELETTSFGATYEYVSIREVYRLLYKRLPTVFIGVLCDIDTALILPYDAKSTEKTTCVFGDVSTRAAFGLRFNCSISPLANAFFPWFKQVELGIQKGDSDTALKSQIKINLILDTIIRYVKGGNFYALLKVCIGIVIGLDLGPSVSQLYDISMGDQRAITKDLKALGIPLCKPVN